MDGDPPTVSVCYKLSTSERLETLTQSLGRVQSQSDTVETVVAAPPKLIGNVARLETADVTIPVENESLTYARNRTAEDATGQIVAFMDSDAWPAPGWVDRLREAIPEKADAAGGPLHPRHDPGWLPFEFHWIVGCGPYYEESRLVPNTYGSNFAVDATAFADVGGFDESIGMGSGGAQQGAETDLARRLREHGYSAVWYDPDAIVIHDVGPEDARLRPVLQRAYEQGRAKASVGTGGRESAFLREELPAALRGGGRSAVASLGLTAAVGAGYLRGACAMTEEKEPDKRKHTDVTYHTPQWWWG